MIREAMFLLLCSMETPMAIDSQQPEKGMKGKASSKKP